jgi:hypothetical protein
MALAAACAHRRALDAAPEEQIRGLIRDLGDDDPEVRDAASRSLAEMGADALPGLRQAQADPDPEVRTRVERLIRTITLEPDWDSRVRQYARAPVTIFLISTPDDQPKVYISSTAQQGPEGKLAVTTVFFSQVRGSASWRGEYLLDRHLTPVSVAAQTEKADKMSSWRVTYSKEEAVFERDGKIKSMPVKTGPATTIDGLLHALSLMPFDPIVDGSLNVYGDTPPKNESTASQFAYAGLHERTYEGSNVKAHKFVVAGSGIPFCFWVTPERKLIQVSTEVEGVPDEQQTLWEQVSEQEAKAYLERAKR